MLRTRAVEVSLREAVLPEEVLRLPEELARVDGLLDDPVFFAPFVPFFDPAGSAVHADGGLPAVDVPQVRYRLGYESLCREVSDSITWRRFCRIPLDGEVPHPTTLMKRPSTRLSVCTQRAEPGCRARPTAWRCTRAWPPDRSH
ncbi:hypothetical protein GCM10009836_45050 [Pseudonocardia ailaonensis]|uniref:Transposase InsH N-terminal domain-containing protein n=1 Tax=Pseudonocardia ailaonensis TaxID=367279 RepID=A0ABN2NBH8_9PSEU